MKRYATIGFGVMSGAALYFAPAAMACNCAVNDTFGTVAPRSQLIVRGKVLNYQWDQADKQHDRPMAMQVEVQEVLNGVNASKQVTIAGDNGMICRRYVSEFPVGTEWVWAVSPDTWSKNGELAISSCGEYALAVKDDKVQGRISPKAKVAESMTLTNLRKLLKVKPQVAGAHGAKRECADRVTKAGV
jgi:hypothetical protein